MLYLIWRFKTPICVITLLILTTVACQSSPAKCCQLDYGLLEITDLAGNWTAAGDIGQEMMESTVKIHRYEQAPVVENAKRYLLRDSDPSKPTVGIFQDLRRYERAAPPLAQLDFRVFSNAEASSSFDPGVAIVDGLCGPCFVNRKLGSISKNSQIRRSPSPSVWPKLVTATLFQ